MENKIRKITGENTYSINRALVTGAGGFVGSHLVEKLLSLGIPTTILVRRFPEWLEQSGDLLKSELLTVVHSDLARDSIPEAATKGVSHLFHLAGAVTAPDAHAFELSNVGITRKLLDCCARSESIKQFIYVSSLAAAGPAESPETPRTETTPDRPVSQYGRSKLAAEAEVLKFKKSFHCLIVRPPIVYGERDLAMRPIIRGLSKGIMIKTPGSLHREKLFSVIHVRDLARCLVELTRFSRDAIPSGEIFYVSEPEILTFEQMFLNLRKALNREKVLAISVPIWALSLVATGFDFFTKITGKTYALNPDKIHEISQDFWICKSDKIKHVIGFHPEYRHEQAVGEMIAWCRNSGWI